MTRHLPEQARREQILAAARRCFIDNGYHPTRMDDIARSAELSKGGVYFHFKSKQEVFECLVEEEYGRSMKFLQEVLGGDESIGAKMQRIGHHYLDYFSTAPDAPRFFIVMGEMSLRDEKVAARLLEMQTTFIDTIARLLEQGIEEGVLRDVNARVVAAMLKALLDGLEGLYALEYPLEVSEFLATGLDLLLRGLAAPGMANNMTA
ncbi:MAG: TetR/AcrR family transcriptional regulator [Myxococcota bacterium]